MTSIIAPPAPGPDGAAGRDELGACLSDVLARIADARDVRPDDCSADDLRRNIALAARASAALEELSARQVAAALHRDLPRHDGAASAAAWLSRATGSSRRAAKGLLDRAAARRRLDPLHGTAGAAVAAWAAGRLSGDHAVVVGHALDTLSPGLAAIDVERAEQHLVTHASELSFDEFRNLANRVVEAVDPDGADAALGERLAAQERRAADQAVFRGQKGLDGLARFAGRIPNLHFDILKTQLEALASPRRDHARSVSEPPASATDPDSGKLIPYGQRLGTAFCELIERTCADELPEHGGNAVTLVVTVDEERLRSGVGAASLATGDEVSVGEARRLACNASILPMVLGGDSKVLDLGMARRLFSKYQRIALAQRDGGCVFPSCERPPAWTEAHHVTPWSAGGPTDVANGVLLCGFHHRLIHRGEWSIRIAPDGVPEVIPPHRIDPSRTPVRHRRHRQRSRPRAG